MKLLAIFGIFLTLIALARAVDVIVVTNQNYPDSAVASVIAKKYGMAIVVIDGLNISEEEINTIKSYNPENIYIIGGPAVISEEVENALRQSFPNASIKRIFGMTKFGTSCEVAKLFNQSFEAIVVVDKGDYPPERGYYKRVVFASKLAQIKGVPILITPEGNLSFEVEETLRKLGVKRVLLIGKDDNVANQLKELGIEVINYKDEDLEKEVEKESKNKKVPLIIVCLRNATDSNAANLIAGHVLFVRNESEVNITLVKEFERVFVLGYPECSNKIADYLISQGIKVEVVSGKKANEVSNKIMEKIKDEIEKEWKEFVEERRKIIVKEKAEEEIENAKKLLFKAILYFENCSKEIDIEELNDTLSEAEKAFNSGNYTKAFELALHVSSKIRSYFWKCRGEIDIDEVFERERVAFRDFFKNWIRRIRGCEIEIYGKRVENISEEDIRKIDVDEIEIVCRKKEILGKKLPLPVRKIIEKNYREVREDIVSCKSDEDCICFDGCGCINKEFAFKVICIQVIRPCQIGKEVCKCINGKCQGIPS
jgi:putative cell wall-binding protein